MRTRWHLNIALISILKNSNVRKSVVSWVYFTSRQDHFTYNSIKKEGTMKRLFSILTLALSTAVLLSSCGGGGGGGGESPANPNQAAVNMQYSWGCPSCGNPAGMDITNQTSTGTNTATISGFIMVCSGNGSCQSFCSASANAENSFSGTVTGNTFSVTNTANPSGWSASGYVVGATMTVTVVSNSNGCYGNQTQTQTLSH